MAKKKATKKTTTKKKSGKRSTKKTTTQKTAATQAVMPESSEAGCAAPYCEFTCNGSEFVLSGQEHGPEYTCPPTYGSCSNAGAMTCFTLGDGGSEAAMQQGSQSPMPTNTSHYTLCGLVFKIVRGNYDVDHYAPPELSIEDVLGQHPELEELIWAAIKLNRCSAVTVTVDAFPREA